jgi:hypothetical protein
VPKQSEQFHHDRYAARQITKQVFWTNPSVNASSGDEHQVAVITEKAKGKGQFFVGS